MKLGEFAKYLRERAGLTQDGLASAAAVSRNTVCNVEDGEAVRIETMRKVYRAGLRLDDGEWKTLLSLWLREVLGKDFDLYGMERTVSEMRVRESEEMEDLGQRFGARLLILARELQEEVLKALERPEVLECLRALNELYDRLKRDDSGASVE